jgi:DNA-directed RNA polymerase specialized sigma subunit
MNESSNNQTDLFYPSTGKAPKSQPLQKGKSGLSPSNSQGTLSQSLGLQPTSMGRPLAVKPDSPVTPRKSKVKPDEPEPPVPPLDAAFARYQSAPIPKHLDAVLDAAKPVLDNAITSFGGQGGPLVQQKARLIAARAVQSYKPDSGTQLKSWMMTNLQELQRYRRKLSPIQTPERAAIELGHLENTRSQLREDLGREPGDMELAEESGLNLKRIKHLKQFSTPKRAEGEIVDQEGESYLPGIPDEHPDNLWAELVYHDLDPVNRRIYDLLVRQQKPVKEVAAKLNISASAVSQRSAKIAAKLDEGSNLTGQL